MKDLLVKLAEAVSFSDTRALRRYLVVLTRAFRWDSGSSPHPASV